LDICLILYSWLLLLCQIGVEEGVDPAFECAEGFGFVEQGPGHVGQPAFVQRFQSRLDVADGAFAAPQCARRIAVAAQRRDAVGKAGALFGGREGYSHIRPFCLIARALIPARNGELRSERDVVNI
jgi:hypothetical protein